jgi:macrolide-specific efflux system membrane fusion protein
MKLKLFLVLLLVVAGGGAIFVSMGGLSASAATTTYLTAQAAVGDVSDDVAATGSIATTASYGLAFGAPAHLVDAAATTSGGSATWPVETVSVALGDHVTKGEKLATASAAGLADDLEAAIANRRSAALQLEIAQEKVDDATTTDATRQAKLSFYQATAQLAQAETAQHDVEAQIAAATLVAPIDGIVTAVNVAPGLDAPSGDAIVVDAATYEVTADVVESDISSVSLGQPAAVAVSSVGADIDGTVSAISPAASTSTSSSNGGTSVVSYAVTVTLTDPPAALRSGMTADITITTASVSNVLTVPAAALTGTAGSYAVRVLGTDGMPQVRQVDVGLVTSTLAEIKSGLNAGDTVITGTANERASTTTTGGFGPGGGTFEGPGGARFQRGGGD